MDSTLNKIFIFAVGAALGSAVTWKFIKSKYKKIADEEIASVKEKFGRGHRAEINPVDDAAEIKPDKTDIFEYQKIVDESGYVNYSTNKEEDKKEEDEEEMNEPYVISPEEFGENDYETESLTYYTDGVLTDENDKVIKDVDNLIGEDALTHFGEYEDDSVFVRNDRLKTDFEILMDYRTYTDAHC